MYTKQNKTKQNKIKQNKKQQIERDEIEGFEKICKKYVLYILNTFLALTRSKPPSIQKINKNGNNENINSRNVVCFFICIGFNLLPNVTVPPIEPLLPFEPTPATGVTSDIDVIPLLPLGEYAV